MNYASNTTHLMADLPCRRYSESDIIKMQVGIPGVKPKRRRLATGHVKIFQTSL